LEANYSLLIEWRIDAIAGGPLKLALGGADVDLSADLAKAVNQKSIETRIPLRCFKDKGANLATVGSALRIQANGGTRLTIRDVRIDTTANNAKCPE
jgi:beta-glucosidase